MTHNAYRKLMLLAGVALLLVGCAGEEAPQEEAPVARPIKTLTVGSTGAREISYPGRVSAGSQVDLSFRVGGPLTSLPVGEGDEIRKGQTVARIDPRDYRIAVESAQARDDKAIADYERAAALYEKDAISKAQLDQARAVRDVASAALEDAEANLSDTELKAPFAGLIGELFVENFQDVRPKQPILSLVGVETVEIQVDLPEAAIATMKPDQRHSVPIVARFDAAPGREFPLEIQELASQANPRTQTYRATFVMPQPDGLNILPGMTATVTGRTAADAAGRIVVPTLAVAPDDAGTPHVWVIDPDTSTVHRRAVTTGALTGEGEIEIDSGLEAGETIAISAVSRLEEGLPIRPMEP